jgi:hypothetical protein
MMDYRLDPLSGYRPILVMLDKDGRRVVRFVDDVKLPEEWEVDKTILPVVD